VFDGADLAVEMFRRLADYGGIKYIGQHVVALCPDGAKLKNSAVLKKQAKVFGKELTKALRA
jgi:hypothetical protein